MRHLLHRLRHRLHLQPIIIVAKWHDEELWVGAECMMCGEVSGAHKSYRNVQRVRI